MTTSSSSKMNQIYIGLGVLAVVGGLYYMQAKKDKATTNTTFTEGSKEGALPQIKVVPEEIDRLALKAKDKPEIVLEKKDGNWTMVAPVSGAKTQKTAVDDLLNGLKGLTFKERVAQGPQNFGPYELEEGKGIHVVASKGGAPVVDLWLGATKTRGQMARLGNDPSGQVYAVSGVSSFTYDKAPKDVRDRKVWDLARENVTQIELKDAKGTFVFTKNETASAADAGAATDAATDAGSAPAWTGTFNGKPLAGLDVAKVDDLLSAFTLGGVLNADDFGDGKSDTETGLASPEATTVSFKTKEGTVFRITMGKSDGTKRYARKDGDATTFLLSEGPSAWAEAGLDKFVPQTSGDAGDAGDGGSDAKK